MLPFAALGPFHPILHHLMCLLAVGGVALQKYAININYKATSHKMMASRVYRLKIIARLAIGEAAEAKYQWHF